MTCSRGRAVQMQADAEDLDNEIVEPFSSTCLAVTSDLQGFPYHRWNLLCDSADVCVLPLQTDNAACQSSIAFGFDLMWSRATGSKHFSSPKSVGKTVRNGVPSIRDLMHGPLTVGSSGDDLRVPSTLGPTLSNVNSSIQIFILRP